MNNVYPQGFTLDPRSVAHEFQRSFGRAIHARKRASDYPTNRAYICDCAVRAEEQWGESLDAENGAEYVDFEHLTRGGEVDV